VLPCAKNLPAAGRYLIPNGIIPEGWHIYRKISKKKQNKIPKGMRYKNACLLDKSDKL